MGNGIDRAVRKGMIVDYVNNNPGISTRQLARRMKMAYGTHFRQLVQEVYEDGLIWRADGAEVAGKAANAWHPPQGVYRAA